MPDPDWKYWGKLAGTIALALSAGTVAGVSSKSALAENDVKEIAREAAREVIRSDLMTDKIEREILRSPRIDSIERTIRDIETGQDMILREIRRVHGEDVVDTNQPTGDGG